MLFTVFRLLELFFSCCIVVAVTKENPLNTPAIVSLANFQGTQMLRHPRLAFDWLSVSLFDYRPIRISGLLLLCTELTLFCIELLENCIYLNQQELGNFFMYIIRKNISHGHSVNVFGLLSISHPTCFTEESTISRATITVILIFSIIWNASCVILTRKAGARCLWKKKKL